MKEMLLSEVITAVDGKFKADTQFKDTYINNITTNSNEVTFGSIFIAIRGGHSYINQAFEKGAVACIVDECKSGYEDERAVIYVKDTVKALLNIAKYYRRLFNIPCIAITGSVGKTSTKDLVACVLSQKYNVHKTQGNYNNEIGLPITVLGLEEEHDILILEMGMSDFGEIHNLSEVAEPDVAIITNIGVSHIENLGSQEGILKAKMEILDFINDNGMFVINNDDDYLSNIKNSALPKNLNVVTVALDNEADYVATNFKQSALDKISFTINKNSTVFTAKTIGKHNALNAMFAYSVAKYFDMNDEEILIGFEKLEMSKNRLDIIDVKGITIINDTYNASPDSMASGIEILNSVVKNGRKIAVLGDMKELGLSSAKLHKDLGKLVSSYKFDETYFIGTEMKEAFKIAEKNNVNCKYFTNNDDLTIYLNKNYKNKDTVYFKGSNSMRLFDVVQNFKNTIEEREV